MDEIIKTETNIILALIDITGFNSSIWAKCEYLSDKNIPSLIITSKHNAFITKESISHGASGVLVKPLIMHELLQLIKKLIDK